MSAIDAEQRARFAHSGFLVLRGALDRSTVAAAYDAVAATVPEDLDDYDALLAGPGRRNYWGDVEPTAPFGRLNDRLYEYAAALVGDGLERPGEFAQVAVRYPVEAAPDDEDHPATGVDGNPHVDWYQGEDDYRPFAVAATAYLDDVVPRGGGLTVWPGTHRRVAEFVAERGLEAYANDDVSAVLGDADTPFEVTGEAGTVVLWHPNLVHTGGTNLARVPRVASFTRFQYQDEGEMRDAVARPFARWDGVPP
ncbi:MAG: phytanoyl-CoA dioxygenase family protein [Halobacteriaceae archaeon]